jgi:5-methylcytosine-specific restriction enzyme subunit McrC
MLEYVGTSDVRYFTSKATVAAAGTNLLDFFVRLFIAECHGIIKAGVRSGYRAETDELSVLRGRLLVREQFMKKRRIAPTIYCEFDGFSSDILENRVIRSALELCRRATRDPDLTRSIATLRSVFEDVSDFLTVSPTTAQGRIVYNRLNEYYRDAHLLAWIIFAGFGVENLKGRGSNVYSFLIDMNRLFEAFVSRLIAGLFSRPAFTVQAQTPIATSFRLLEPEKLYAQMQPDLYITANGGTEYSLPLDVKYKRYDVRHLDQADLYQLSIYALDAKPVNGRYRALLIYPSENPSGTQRRIGMRGRQHVPMIDIFILGIHVPSLIAQVRNDPATTEYRNSIREVVRNVLTA